MHSGLPTFFLELHKSLVLKNCGHHRFSLFLKRNVKNFSLLINRQFYFRLTLCATSSSLNQSYQKKKFYNFRIFFRLKTAISQKEFTTGLLRFQNTLTNDFQKTPLTREIDYYSYKKLPDKNCGSKNPEKTGRVATLFLKMFSKFQISPIINILA